MIKERSSFKLTNLIFLILLFFPLLHFWGEARMFMRPVFLFVIGVISFILLSKGKLFSSTILKNLVVQVYIVFLFLQFYFQWDIEIIPYIFLLALFLFYKIAIAFLSANDNSNEHILIIGIYTVIIGIEILLFALSKKNVFLNFFPNESIFSILIAAQLLFITPYFKKYNESIVKNKRQAKILLICYLLLCYCLLFYTEGRAGILGFTVAQGILNYSYLKLKVGYFKGIIIAFCLIFIVLNFKSNSSNGRLLIYKVIITQLELKEFATGIGYGKFKVKYNELQAKYFSKESIDNKEALLASNTFYMFNDPLQLIIETGLVGLIILSFLLIKFLALFRRNQIFFREKPILNGAYLSVIGIIISSLFSYPFQIMGVLLHFLFCIAIIIDEDSAKKLLTYPTPLQKRFIILSRTSQLSVAVCLLFFGQESFKFYIKLNEAIKYSNIGFRKKAIQTYSKISDNSMEDRDVLYNYADELAKINKIDSALIILRKASNYLNNDKSALLMGNLLQQKGMFSQAEKQYKKAVFINPKLFTNRASLFKFYCETKQFKKALYWGNSILKMPVKVPSKTITDIKNETRKIMSEIKKTLKTV
jgi:tetratricopeptide (TPR) repeat protein